MAMFIVQSGMTRQREELSIPFTFGVLCSISKLRKEKIWLQEYVMFAVRKKI